MPDHRISYFGFSIPHSILFGSCDQYRVNLVQSIKVVLELFPYNNIVAMGLDFTLKQLREQTTSQYKSDMNPLLTKFSLTERVNKKQNIFCSTLIVYFLNKTIFLVYNFVYIKIVSNRPHNRKHMETFNSFLYFLLFPKSFFLSFAKNSSAS